ncbi:hypothetical protein GQ457_17G017200 [Hibiscus cannabinus]
MDGAPFSFLLLNLRIIFNLRRRFPAKQPETSTIPKILLLAQRPKRKALTVFLSLSRALVQFPEKKVESNELLGLGFACFSFVSLFGISLILPGSRKSSNL